MKKLKLIFTMGLVIFSMTAMAQSSYKSSIGLRLGNGYYDIASVAYKTFLSEAGALEFNAGIRPYGSGAYKWTNAAIAGSYQHHFPIKPVEGLKWFVGGGVIVSNTFSNIDGFDGLSVGVFPTAGADYKFKTIPLAVSADVRPTFNVVEAFDYSAYKGFYPNVGISARYTLK